MTRQKSMITFGVCIAVFCWMTSVLSQERPPDFKKIIRNNIAHFDPLRAALIEEKTGQYPPEVPIQLKGWKNIEISDTNRHVQTNLYGLGWQTCIRATRDKSVRLLAVFVVENRVVDVRTAIIPDACDSLTYRPLL
jgi:hypothetical protein